MEGRPQHLVEFAMLLRAVRREARLTLDQLAEKVGYSKTPLSRAQGGTLLPTWAVTEAFLVGCGVDDLGPWRRDWQRARDIDATAVRPAKPHPANAATRENHVAPLTEPATTGSISALGESGTLAAFLKKAETQDELLEGVRRLARRSGCESLREIEARTTIPKSTISDWFSGKRKPNRLDELVSRLGANKLEQREFLTCLERTWSVDKPYVIFGSQKYVGTLQGAHCYQMTMILYDRSVMGGDVTLVSGHSDSIIGIGPASEYCEDSTVELPAMRAGSLFSIGIWVRPDIAEGERIAVQVALKTSEDRFWLIRRNVVIPAVSAVPGSSTTLPPPTPRTEPNGARAIDGIDLSDLRYLDRDSIVSVVESALGHEHAVTPVATTGRRWTWPGMNGGIGPGGRKAVTAGPSPYTPVRPQTEYKARHRRPGPAE
jgi:transcriptional regulator with XRE-family HTH domain